MLYVMMGLVEGWWSRNASPLVAHSDHVRSTTLLSFSVPQNTPNFHFIPFMR